MTEIEMTAYGCDFGSDDQSTLAVQLADGRVIGFDGAQTRIVLALIREREEATRRACAKIADDLGDKDKNDNLVNDALQWCAGYEAGCREIATTIRATSTSDDDDYRRDPVNQPENIR